MQELAPWRSLIARALHLNRSQPHSRYLQLATVNAQGLPTNRTVVFRGFLENSNQLQIVTDLRSDKVSQIQQQPWGEACWYFTKTREQFRLAGNLTLVTADFAESSLLQQRQQIWQKLSDAARLQFTWPDPGKSRVSDSAAFATTPPSETEPLANFCLLLLNPQKVDHLELKGEPQNRHLYLKESNHSWSMKEINP
ncbi:MAG TPA: Npun_F5749 family FMN-dependent PPOX-type flavoprotein [Xenococcaceae cyanobacterium]